MLLAPMLIAITAAATPAATTPSAPEALVPRTPVPDLEVLHTGDVVGYLDTCGCKVNPSGGLARRAWLVSQVREAFPDAGLLLLDSGNLADSPTAEGEAKSRALVEGMNRLGYAAANVGERELAAGWDGFRRATEGARFPFVSANLLRREDAAPVLPPYAVVQVGRASGAPVRVGVVGLMRHSPVFQKAGPDGSTLVTAPPAERLRTLLPAVRAQADVVVVLASLPEPDARELARAFPDVDLVLGAFGGVLSAQEDPEGAVPVRYTGVQGRAVGEVRLTLGDDLRKTSAHARMHTLTARYPSDPDTAAFVARSLSQAAALRAAAGEAGTKAVAKP